MRSRQRLRTPRPGHVDWRWRVPLAVAAALLAMPLLSQGLASATVNSVPQRAYERSVGDGRITAALAARRLSERKRIDPELVLLARQAVRQDATAVSAVVVLGLDAQIHGRVAVARRLFAYAFRLSRRNAEAHLWGIEDAVARDDIPAALRHYDMALRVSRSMTQLLFPVLAAAVTDAQVRHQVEYTLARKPSWAPLFIEYLAGNAPDPVAAAQTLVGTARLGQPVAPVAQALMTEKLLSGGRNDEAWRFYSSLRPGVRRDRLRDATLTANLAVPTVFDWQSVATDGLVATIEPGSIVFSVPPATAGTLVQQVQMFPPGRYRFEGRARDVELSGTSPPYWQVTCRGDEREIARAPIRGSTGGEGRFATDFAISSDCPVQNLRLVATSADATTESRGAIGPVQLAPLAP